MKKHLVFTFLTCLLAGFVVFGQQQDVRRGGGSGGGGGGGQTNYTAWDVLTYTNCITTVANIPLGRTAPQISAGALYTNFTYNTQYTNTLVKFVITGTIGSSVDNNVVVALFKDGATDAVAATTVTSPGTGNVPFTLVYSFTSTTTNSSTYMIRFGPVDTGNIGAYANSFFNEAFPFSGKMYWTVERYQRQL